MKVTYYEQQVIDYCVANGQEDMGSWATLDQLWTNLPFTQKQICGLITSLQNKGLGYVEETNGKKASSVFWLTDKAQSLN